ncbi:MAG: D-glycero-beta-D-manno-heptose 1,7-bisphosphate 7-phosphatase [Desulfuromonadales bacterium]|nr:D-glycero-beta-D-manno-heptose 1,7-bisphosphate 7-phosphatase [Desulfuromonadales bacterium]
MKSITHKAVFLDRDGTLNVESGYIFKIEDIKFIPGVKEGLSLLKSAGFLLVVITNQAGVAKNLYTIDDLEKLHNFMQNELEEFGVGIDGWYFCPHHPEYGELKECNCRKPLPGMIYAAANDLNIDLSASWVVGDKTSDILAGIAAGCRSVLVETGYGETEKQSLPERVTVCRDILEAAKFIIAA